MGPWRWWPTPAHSQVPGSIVHRPWSKSPGCPAPSGRLRNIHPVPVLSDAKEPRAKEDFGGGGLGRWEKLSKLISA